MKCKQYCEQIKINPEYERLPTAEAVKLMALTLNSISPHLWDKLPAEHRSSRMMRMHLRAYTTVQDVFAVLMQDQEAMAECLEAGEGHCYYMAASGLDEAADAAVDARWPKHEIEQAISELNQGASR